MDYMGQPLSYTASSLLSYKALTHGNLHLDRSTFIHSGLSVLDLVLYITVIVLFSILGLQHGVLMLFVM